MKNLPHSLESSRYIGVGHSHSVTEVSPLPSTQPLFRKLDERVHFKQMIRAGVNIQIKKEHSQLHYSLPAAKCFEISLQRSKTVHLEAIEDGAKT
jgi:hypothetical protein